MLHKELSMEQNHFFRLLGIFAMTCVLGVATFFAQVAQANPWVTGYYTAYSHLRLTPAAVDYSSLTHIVYYGVIPNANGTINGIGVYASGNTCYVENASTGVTTVTTNNGDGTYTSNTPGTNDKNPYLNPYGFDDANARELISRAHSNGVKVLLCIGGGGTSAVSSSYGFTGSLSTSSYRTALVNNIMALVDFYGFDGVDVDAEGLNLGADGMSQQDPNFDSFMIVLDYSLAHDPNPPSGKLLTATGSMLIPPARFVNLAGHIDEFNLMTYDFGNNWPGWKSWFNSSRDSDVYLDNGTELPSIRQLVNNWKNAYFNGIGPGGGSGHLSPLRIGFGIPFYSTFWTGVTSYGTDVDATTTEKKINYQTSQDICNNFLPVYLYPTINLWYGVGHEPYLSIPTGTTGYPSGAFLSFENSTSISQKIWYLNDQGLGGVILWSLNDGYVDSGPNVGQNPLLTDVKNAVNAYYPGTLQ
jgi:chitinase